jgi:hypothetical protein
VGPTTSWIRTRSLVRGKRRTCTTAIQSDHPKSPNLPWKGSFFPAFWRPLIDDSAEGWGLDPVCALVLIPKPPRNPQETRGNRATAFGPEKDPQSCVC